MGGKTLSYAMRTQSCTKGEVSVALPLSPKQGAYGETPCRLAQSLSPARSSLHKGAMEADCPEPSAQQAPVNNYFMLALLVIVFALKLTS